MKKKITKICSILLALVVISTVAFGKKTSATLTANITAVHNVDCNGGNSGWATVTASGGVMPYTYQWLPSGGNGATGTGLTVGSYTVIVTDNISNTASASVTITEPTLLMAMANQVVQIYCYGSCNAVASVIATGGTPPYTYLWAPSGCTNQTCSGLCAYTYTVDVTDANGCNATATVNITQPGQMFVNAYQYGTSCTGGCAVANISGGTSPYTYYWFPSGNTTDTVCGLSMGTYTVSGTDQNGCTGTGTVVITIPAGLTAATSSTANTSCSIPNGTATATASGGTGPYTYYWLPSLQTTPTAVGLNGGVDSCIITDHGGCTYTAVVTVGGPSGILIPSITVGMSNTGCTSFDGWADAVPSNGNPPYTYLWTPGGQTNAIASALSAGSYTCVVQDVSGCSATTTTTVGNGPGLMGVTFMATPDSNNCKGSAMAIPIAGTSPFTYAWSGGQTTMIATGLCPGVVCVTVTDNLGCSVTGCDTILSSSGCSGNPSLCYVTSDTNSLHNILYWDRTGIDTLSVDSFLIYRGITTFIYQKIAQVSVHAHTVYTDITSNPTIESYYYEIGLSDTCKTYPISSYHQSILLQASWGLGTTMNLSWNYYQGATVNYYKILRDDSGTGKWHALDSVPGGDNAYTDFNAPINSKLRYRLSVNWDVTCTPYLHFMHKTNEPSAAYSNITNLHGTGIDGLNLQASNVDVYPNPANDILNVSMSVGVGGANFILTDVLGREVKAISHKPIAGGSVQTINIESLQAGIYFLTIESNGQKIVKKVTKL